MGGNCDCELLVLKLSAGRQSKGQITSFLPPDFESRDYLPIFPTKKFQKGGIQLKLCDSFDEQTLLRLRSYIRINNVKEVPLEILDEMTRCDGFNIMLQQNSFDVLDNAVRARELFNSC